MATASINSSDKGISLKGNLVFSTVTSVLEEGNKYLATHQDDSVSIDLSDVERIDSAGITLLLEWKRLCDKHNKKYQIIGAQDQISSLITTNKMQGVLSLS